MKKKKFLLFKNYIILGVLLFVVFNLLVLNVGSYLKYRFFKKDYDKVLIELEAEEQRLEKIENKIKKLDTRKGKDDVLININPIKREGERVIKILDY